MYPKSATFLFRSASVLLHFRLIFNISPRDMFIALTHEHYQQILDASPEFHVELFFFIYFHFSHYSVSAYFRSCRVFNFIIVITLVASIEESVM